MKKKVLLFALLFFALFSLTSCKKEQIATPVLSIESNVVTWEPVLNATEYVPYINNIKMTNQTETTYTINVIDEGTYNFYVIALAADGFLDSEKSNTVSYVHVKLTLDTPVVILNGNVISWNAITGASAYTVKIGNEVMPPQTETSYTIGQLLPGTYSISVKALAGSRYNDSAYSQPISYNANITQLQAPSINISGNVVSWSQIDNAEGYAVYINDLLTVTSQTELSYTLTMTPAGTYTTKIKALGDGEYYSNSDYSNAVNHTIDFIQLNSPVISLSNQTVSWTAVSHATGYRVYVNEVMVVSNQSTTSYTISQTAAGTYNVQVVALGDGKLYSNSNYSNTVTYSIDFIQLSKPVLTLSSHTVNWTSIANAVGYAVYVDGELVVASQTANSYTVTGAPATYTITVVALGNGINYLDSVQSDSISCTILPKISAPTLTLTAATVSWSAVDNAVQYIVMVNDVVKSIQTQTSYILSNTAGTYNVKVKAVADRVVYADSDYSSITTCTITALTAPTISLNGNLVSWSAITNAIGYTVYVNGIAVSANQTGLSYTMTQTSAGNYNVTVRAIGSTIYANSEYSNIVTYSVASQLSAPTGLAVNGSVVSWNPVANASYYIIKVNGSEKAQQTSLTYNVGDIAGSYTVAVMAVGNGTTYSNSAYSSNYTFTLLTRLATPTISNNESIISWSAITNAVSYNVYVNGTLQINQTETTYTVTTVLGTYVVYIVAVGDNVSYRDSLSSNSVTVYNLETLLTPQIYFQVSGNTIRWDAIANATSYSVSVNSGSYTVTNNYYQFIPASGNYLISVIAIGDPLQYNASTASEILILVVTGSEGDYTVTDYKTAKIAEITNYLIQSDYRTEEVNSISNLITNYSASIHQSTTVAAVDSIVSTAKNALDEIVTDLELTIEESVTELNSYANLDAYDTAERAQVVNLINLGVAEIEAATSTIVAINTLSTYEASIDEILTLDEKLALAQQTAITELNGYIEDINAYDSAEQTLITDTIDEATYSINQCFTLSDIYIIMEAVTYDLFRIPTSAEKIRSQALLDAIDAANDDDVITLTSGRYICDLTINKPLSIVGVSGTYFIGTITVNTTGDFTLENITFVASNGLDFSNSYIDIISGDNVTLTNLEFEDITNYDSIISIEATNFISVTIMTFNDTCSANYAIKLSENTSTPLADGSSITASFMYGDTIAHFLLLSSIADNANIYIDNNRFEYSEGTIEIAANLAGYSHIYFRGNYYDTTSTLAQASGIILVHNVVDGAGIGITLEIDNLTGPSSITEIIDTVDANGLPIYQTSTENASFTNMICDFIFLEVNKLDNIYGLNYLVDLDNYSIENQAVIQGYIADGTDEINASLTVNDSDSIYIEYETLILAVPTL